MSHIKYFDCIFAHQIFWINEYRKSHRGKKTGSGIGY